MRPLRALLFSILLGAPAHAQGTPAELIQALQAAARAGDADAYRALLGGSGTFSVEGRNFAADLARVPQPSVTYKLSELRVDGDHARARLTLSWERTVGAVSLVSLPVRLERRDDVWRYAGEDMQVIPAGTFTLGALNEADLPQRAAVLAPLLSGAAAQVQAVLGLTASPGATVKVYPSMSALSASVNLSLQPVGGWNEPGEAIKLVLPDGGTAERGALRLLSHEFAHLSVSAALEPGTDKRVPWWLHEGLADWVSSAYWADGRLDARHRSITTAAQRG